MAIAPQDRQQGWTASPTLLLVCLFVLQFVLLVGLLTFQLQTSSLSRFPNTLVLLGLAIATCLGWLAAQCLGIYLGVEGRSLWPNSTARQQAEQRLRAANAEMRALFSAMDDLILIYDRQGRHLRTLSDNARLLYEPEEHRVGRSLHEVFPPATADEFLSYIHQALDTRQMVRKEYALMVNGEEVWSDACMSPIDNDTVIWAIRDITDRKRATLQQAELLEQTRQQATALQQAKEAADAANSAKSLFIATMSHELRTPLTAILGFTQLMMDDPNLTPSQQENLLTINRSGEHLLELINAVLDISKIGKSSKERLAESASLTHQVVHLPDLLRSLRDTFQVQAAAKAIALTLELDAALPQYIQTDASKLRQVLTNLLNNALKFTFQGQVQLRVRTIGIPVALENTDAAQPPDLLHFEIADTGPGIAPAELDSLFQPFVQTTAGRNSQQGTGLGLFISRGLVERLGGEIGVHSRLGEGSTFWFTLPIQPAIPPLLPVMESRKGLKQVPGQLPYRILVVDDVLTNRQLLRRTLEPLGFTVEQAEDGETAIALWQSWQPHLILMDMHMPTMDGYGATQRIRSLEVSSPLAQRTPILALTAIALTHEQPRIWEAGCDDILYKPFHQQALLDRIGKALSIEFVDQRLPAEAEWTADLSTPVLANSAAVEIAGEHDDTLNDCPAPASLTVNTADLQKMPSLWLTRLNQAAAQANGRQVSQLLAEIPESQTYLRKAIAAHLQHFRFDVIMQQTAQALQ